MGDVPDVGRRPAVARDLIPTPQRRRGGVALAVPAVGLAPGHGVVLIQIVVGRVEAPRHAGSVGRIGVVGGVDAG